MKTFDQFVLPFGTFLAAAFVAFVADRAARLRRPDGDRGDYWTRAVQRICLFLALPLLLSGALETVVPKYWLTGRHLHLDLTSVFGWSFPASYRIALLLPFAVWGGLLLFGVGEKPGDRTSARWLAGGIGFDSSRRWVLLCGLPFALVVLLTPPRLGGGQYAYPGAAWGTAAILLLSLAGVALSAGNAASRPAGARQETAASSAALQPWPQALAAHGIKLRRVTSWPASGEARAARPASGNDLAAHFRLLGAREIAPELIEAIDALVEGGSGTGEHGPARIVIAPDGCGQAEAVALGALLLEQRLHATTLVITAGDAAGLAAQLRLWLPTPGAVGVYGATDEPPWHSLLWVVEAQVLSDRLLPLLKDPLLVRRFGLIVWWHLEAYTGVLAANLWAISRRLHRLLQARGRRDVRTLALVRSAPHGSAQLASFVRRLLPHPFPSGSEVQVAQRFPREVQLHLLESHQAHFARGEGRDVQVRHRHLPLVAARVSVEERWPTCLEVPPDVAEPEASAVLQLPAAGSILRDHLRIDPAAAGARLLHIEPADVLSLPEIVCQGGRTSPDGLPHHVALTLPANPYVAHLFSRLEGRDSGTVLDSSRRLVAAEALPAVIRRHLLLALNELPDTRNGLLKNFLWNEEVIRKTLEEISQEGKLTRREVRFLAEGDRLMIDHEYSSRRLPSGDQRPLDTVGTSLVEVRELAGGYDTMGGVRLRVDPERVTVQAYPHRVFLQGGQRYRIREWGSLDEVLHSRSIACDREAVHSQTWRIRNPLVFGVEPTRPPVGVGRSGRLLSRFPARLTYEEEVMGALRVAPDLTSGQTPRPETLRLARPILQSFATRALVLRFPEDAEPLALASLAQALRHVLPVHLGVDEDALEVVPLTGERVDGLPTFGLAIVDLYPGGIGLVDEIVDDNPFLLHLLEQTRDWLQACSCQSDTGCDRCLRSPAALAANIDQPPLREAALSLLRQVV